LQEPAVADGKIRYILRVFPNHESARRNRKIRHDHFRVRDIPEIIVRVHDSVAVHVSRERFHHIVHRVKRPCAGFYELIRVRQA
jgi:hypothetical protein